MIYQVWIVNIKWHVRRYPRHTVSSLLNREYVFPISLAILKITELFIFHCLHCTVPLSQISVTVLRKVNVLLAEGGDNFYNIPFSPNQTDCFIQYLYKHFYTLSCKLFCVFMIPILRLCQMSDRLYENFIWEIRK